MSLQYFEEKRKGDREAYKSSDNDFSVAILEH